MPSGETTDPMIPSGWRAWRLPKRCTAPAGSGMPSSNVWAAASAGFGASFGGASAPPAGSPVTSADDGRQPEQSTRTPDEPGVAFDQLGESGGVAGGGEAVEELTVGVVGVGMPGEGPADEVGESDAGHGRGLGAFASVLR